MAIMKSAILLVITGLLTGTVWQANAASLPNNGHDDPSDTVQAALGSVSAAELPAKIADLVTSAKPPEREAMALAAIQFAAAKYPGSIVPDVSSAVAALPRSAPAIAGAAAKLIPSEAQAITSAAAQAAPRLSEEITRAVAAAVPPKFPGTPPGAGHSNRPTVPPGLAGGSKPGTVHGNRPGLPPGLDRDPKPGRDPQNYGKP